MEPTTLFVALALGLLTPPPADAPDAFAGFTLPEAWQTKFGDSPNARALLKFSPKALADLVPVQAGIRWCRCPNCDAAEADDPLGSWSVVQPAKVTCRKCGVIVPNDKFPAHEDKKPAPAEEVEVAPGVVHKYPYHEVESTRQRYPEERLYLQAKADYEAREFLAKAALYAAVRYRDQAEDEKDPDLARLACVILVRFAQVYPLYATHLDQPASAKFFQPADLPPPYRSGYRTAKWDWTASQDVPLNLVVAYAILRSHPAISEAGKLLGESAPNRLIERQLFRASAEFVINQPEECSEAALSACRGILAVGRLLDDETLVNEARVRLDRFSRRGFYYDGYWRQGALTAHRRILGLLDGWIDHLLTVPGHPDAAALATFPMLSLARRADDAGAPRTADVLRASWAAPTDRPLKRLPTLLGGSGIARLAVGQGDAALDVELRSLDAVAPERVQRQALRVAVGGQLALGDLDESPGLASGFDRATASRNTVVVDGLNQRESLATASEPVAGGDFVFFAADPDFQVVCLDDRRAYPASTSTYRQTLLASASPHSRYAVSVFEVVGGLQHEQLFHDAPGSSARWTLSQPMQAAPKTLLPPGLTFLPNAPAEQGRWFVQAFGEFVPLGQTALTRPVMAWTRGRDGEPGAVRLHILGEGPTTAVTASSPDPLQASREGADEEVGRGSLILRRRSADGATLRSTFVTLVEPVGRAFAPLPRVGRAASPEGTVVLFVETADGPEHVVVNLTPSKAQTVVLGDGRSLTTDGLVVRVSTAGLVLAGGTFASCGGQTVRQESVGGKILGSERRNPAGGGGWFVADAPLPDPVALAGRTLFVRHGDGSTHGWTIERVENRKTTARIYVREEPGFQIDPDTGAARFYQFPETTLPGPHAFRVSRIAR